MDDTSHTAMRSLETDGMLKLVEAHARACRHSPRQIADHHVAEGVRQRGHHSRGVCRDVGRIRDKKFRQFKLTLKPSGDNFLTPSLKCA